MADHLAFTLHELIGELDAFADARLRARHGVGFTLFEFLAVLSDAEPADMTTLARCLGVTKAAVSKRVPSLVADGWITAASEAGSGRSVSLALTPKGAELVRVAGGDLEEAFTRFVAHPALAGDPIDSVRLNRQLVALTSVIRERSGAPGPRPAPTPGAEEHPE